MLLRTIRELLVDERDDMAPRRERQREVLCCGRRRMKNIRRDEVDYLPEDRVHCLRCFWWCLFLHNPVGYRITPPVATLNSHPIANAVSEWDANEHTNSFVDRHFRLALRRHPQHKTTIWSFHHPKQREPRDS